MKYVASCSFGKDSLATIILAHEHNEPLDEIVYCEVMFSDEVSGEVPEHKDFIYNVAIPKLEAWGYKVTVLRSKKTFIDSFNHLLVRGANEGKKRGFPYFAGCCIQRDCKLPPMKAYWKDQMSGEVTQYIGYAIDEQDRIGRLDGKTKISLLEKYGYTEKMARELCERYGLLSPIYQFARRNGCWFCPNAGPQELRHLYQNHRDYVEMLMELEKTENLQPAGRQFNRDGPPSVAFIPYELEAAQITFDDYMNAGA